MHLNNIYMTALNIIIINFIYIFAKNYLMSFGFKVRSENDILKYLPKDKWYKDPKHKKERKP